MQTKLFVDNRACIELSKQTLHPSDTDHIAVKVHYLRDLSERGELELEYVPTDKQLADILKKVLVKLKPRRNSCNTFFGS